ncbi:SusC/RagA family TonB-linked outer membrane protein [Flammeovirga aprica]|uniref:SusC/RagA family TonB-linked outer membrane protein n=1 Tax=Flammeovirga aprica JL-4 TaxID=694437 RepID=A0A7X9RYF0_9BACT|nr:SusC/RagA family TonB-linked outer membrane protein [Flammeovirga aprica]NME71026.1 SusC/RagA family TonB-linked outer membrane protein [Flammeovirga aprica JL-4]
MKNRIHTYRSYIETIGVMLLLLISSVGFSQNKDFVEVKCRVVDERHFPIRGAVLTVPLLDGSEDVFYTDSDGQVVITGLEGDAVLIEAEGMKPQDYKLKTSEKKKAFFMRPLQLYYEKIALEGGFQIQRREESTSFSSKIDDKYLSHTYGLNVGTAITGTDPSVLVEQLTSNPGWDLSNMTIRGLSTTGDNAPVVFVDGFERSIYQINIEEIESIEYLKDIRAKILAGPSAINGVIWITTKKGEAVKRKIDVGYEQGVQTPTTSHHYLDSYNSALLYNEARRNDGLSPFYTDADLEGFKSGNDLMKYPNNDFSNLLLKDQTSYQKAYVSLTGATRNSKYAVNMGYQRQEGMVAKGPENGLDRFNIRANLKARMNSIITLNANISARTEIINSSTLTGRDFFGLLSSHRPHEYPLLFPENTLGDNAAGFGVSRLVNRNIYAEVTERGFEKEQRIMGQTNMGLDFNLKRITEGLSADVNVGIDTYNSVTYGQKANYNSYFPIYRADTLSSWVRKSRKTELGSQSKTSDDVMRTYAMYGRLKYDRTFNSKHHVYLQGMYSFYRQEIKSSIQEPQNMTTSLLASYTFNKRYIVEGIISNYGTNRLNNQPHQLNYVGSVGWVISEEDFMQQGIFDYLKLKANYGLMSTDRSFLNHRWHDNVWKQSGNVYLGNNNNTTLKTTDLQHTGSEHLIWEKQEELNVGIEGRIRNNFSFYAHYFHTYRYDIPEQVSNKVINGQTFTKYENYGQVKNEGVELSLDYKNKINRLRYRIGVGGMYTQSKVLDGNFLDYNEQYQNRVGKPVNAIYGYASNGLFQSYDEINNHSSQNFGTLRPGDIKFVDNNGDGVITKADKTIIGDTFPDFIVNSHIKLNYKHFELFAQFSGVIGREVLLNNTYFWNYGEEKYTDYALNRWSESNPNGTHPRLTTKEVANNYQSTDYWVESGDYIRLDNLQLTYRVPVRKWTKNVVHNFKIYARGNNLFTWSKLKNVDPSNINSGYTNFPLLKSYVIGIHLTI